VLLDLQQHVMQQGQRMNRHNLLSAMPMRSLKQEQQRQQQQQESVAQQERR
jgi:hypothetical protein